MRRAVISAGNHNTNQMREKFADEMPRYALHMNETSGKVLVSHGAKKA